MQDMNEICKTAWDSTKKEHQPAYDTLEQSYKEMLINRAGAVQNGTEMEDGPFREFDSRVAAQLEVPEPAAEVPAEVKEELVEEAVAEEEEEEEEEPPTALEKEHLELKGPLPKDFPKHELLHEAGINTYGQLLKCEDLTAVDGVGPATVKEIKKRLKADAKALNK